MITTHVIRSGSELKEVIAQHDNVIVDFFKDGCAPCKMVELLFKELIKKQDTLTTPVHILKVQLEVVGEEVFGEYGVRSTPTLLFIKEGQVVRSNPGIMMLPMFLNAIEQHF